MKSKHKTKLAALFCIMLVGCRFVPNEAFPQSSKLRYRPAFAEVNVFDLLFPPPDPQVERDRQLANERYWQEHPDELPYNVYRKNGVAPPTRH